VFIAAGSRYTACGSGTSHGRVSFGSVKFGEGFFCVFRLFAIGVELEVELVFGDGFVFFLHLLQNLREGEVSEGVVGLDADGVFGTEIRTLVVLVVHVELCDGDVFVDALVVGLNLFDLGEFAADGMNCVVATGRLGCGIRIVAAGATATGVRVCGTWRRGAGEWVLRGGIGWSG